MEFENLLKFVDHTQLKPFATFEDIKKLCDEAIKYKTATVCIPPCYIKRVKDEYKDFKICTVIGFPLGYNTTEIKVLETKKAIQDGAIEIDMVINISDVKNKDYDKIKEEIVQIKKACEDKILKVIIETCYLTEEEKIELCNIITDVKADYIKTSTGFGTKGATIEDIKLFKKHIGKDVKIKAAGGIKSIEDMQEFLKEGASRLGTSSAIDIIKNIKSNFSY